MALHSTVLQRLTSRSTCKRHMIQFITYQGLHDKMVVHGLMGLSTFFPED